VDVHLRPALFGKVGRVAGPGLTLLQGGRLFPPAILVQHVQAPVSVHITDTQPVRELLPSAVLADGAEGPGAGRIAPVRLNVAVPATVNADDLGPTISGEVEPGGRLIVDTLEDKMPLPVPLTRLPGIAVPGRLLTREADDEDVVPAVVVEVVDVGEEIVRVPFRIERLRGIVLVPLGELGTGVPVRTGHDIHHPIPVEIPVGRPFRVEGLREHDFAEGMQRRFRVGSGGGASGERGQSTEQRSDWSHDRLIPGRGWLGTWSGPKNSPNNAQLATV